MSDWDQVQAIGLTWIGEAFGPSARGSIPFGVCPYGAVSLLPGQRKALDLTPRSILVFLFPYYTGPLPGRNLSRHATLLDYHRVAGDFLEGLAVRLSAFFPQNAFAPFVDVSPIPEVEAAVRAGLGRRGWNNQLLHPLYGPYCFIGELVTDLALPPTGDGLGDCQECPGCGRCRAACPTGALTPAGFDRERCRSLISQKKGSLTPWEAEQLRDGGLVWGCDICLEVCPLAQDPAVTPISAFTGHVIPWITQENLREVATLHSCGWRGEGVLRRNMALLGNGKQ